MVTVVVAAVYKIAESKIRRMVRSAGVNALFGEARETVEAGLPSRGRRTALSTRFSKRTGKRRANYDKPPIASDGVLSTSQAATWPNAVLQYARERGWSGMRRSSRKATIGTNKRNKVDY